MAAQNRHRADAMDHTKLQHARELMGDQFAGLVEGFLLDVQYYWQRMFISYCCGDVDGLSHYAHLLKSACGGLGIDQLNHLSAGIEHLANVRAPAEDFIPWLDALASGYRRTFAELQQMTSAHFHSAAR